MIPELGHYALILALGVALLQVLLPIYGWLRRDQAALAAGPAAALTQTALVVIGYACLTALFVQNDFSVLYVASNSHSQLPLMYRVTAVWGAHEGSLLLWLLMLCGWSSAVTLAGRRLPAEIIGLVTAVLGAISVGFLSFLLLTSNPFDRLVPAAAEGRDLNPLAAGPGHGDPSADALHGLRRLLGGVRVRHRRAADRTPRRAHGCGGRARGLRRRGRS